jgi:transcriptional regulator with XRE-family HTH domain
MVQKHHTVELFRQRLSELIGRTELTQARFADKAGLDRSTLSQLLSPTNVRLPRAETVVRIATRHGASIDWLLGLSELPQVAADIVSQPIVQPGADDPANEQLKRWHEEARGSKVRYVPSTIPDQLKTEAVIAYETGRFTPDVAEAMAGLSHARIDHARSHDSEIEVCSSHQSVELLASGLGIWRQLPLRERRRQLEHMAAMVEELYPAYRWFLFDSRERYSAPYTVFGQKRAAIYMGAMFIVFTSTEHIRELTQHFDDLICHARVQPNETAGFISKLAKDIA